MLCELTKDFSYDVVRAKVFRSAKNFDRVIEKKFDLPMNHDIPTWVRMGNLQLYLRFKVPNV